MMEEEVSDLFLSDGNLKADCNLVWSRCITYDTADVYSPTEIK